MYNKHTHDTHLQHRRQFRSRILRYWHNSYQHPALQHSKNKTTLYSHWPHVSHYLHCPHVSHIFTALTLVITLTARTLVIILTARTLVIILTVLTLVIILTTLTLVIILTALTLVTTNLAETLTWHADKHKVHKLHHPLTMHLRSSLCTLRRTL